MKVKLLKELRNSITYRYSNNKWHILHKYTNTIFSEVELRDCLIDFFRYQRENDSYIFSNWSSYIERLKYKNVIEKFKNL